LTIDAPLIIDAHCHVIVPEMTAVTVPEHWRPVITREHGHQVVGFRGHERAQQRVPRLLGRPR